MNKTDSSATSTNSPIQQLSVEDRVRISFVQLGYSQLNAVVCKSEGDSVLLTGKLDSFYLKQVAQSVAVKIPGVRSVRNEIEVS